MNLSCVQQVAPDKVPLISKTQCTRNSVTVSGAPQHCQGIVLDLEDFESAVMSGNCKTSVDAIIGNTLYAFPRMEDIELLEFEVVLLLDFERLTFHNECLKKHSQSHDCASRSKTDLYPCQSTRNLWGSLCVRD